LEDQKHLYQESKHSKKKKKKKSSTPVIGKSIWKLMSLSTEKPSHTHTVDSSTDNIVSPSGSPTGAHDTSNEDSSGRNFGKGMKIDELLLENLKNQGIERLFPIQREAIPQIVTADKEHRFGMGDICISAPTGSGKTLVYVIPIIQNLLERSIPRLRALVIVPTHELVNQVYETFKQCAKGTSLRIFAMTAEMPFLEQQEILQESDAGYINAENIPKTGIDILISTPGRLTDHLDNTPGFSLEHLQYVAAALR
jgi:superfamily II DNA/RNA helicase